MDSIPKERHVRDVFPKAAPMEVVQSWEVGFGELPLGHLIWPFYFVAQYTIGGYDTHFLSLSCGKYHDLPYHGF